MTSLFNNSWLNDSFEGRMDSVQGHHFVWKTGDVREFNSSHEYIVKMTKKPVQCWGKFNWEKFIYIWGHATVYIRVLHAVGVATPLPPAPRTFVPIPAHLIPKPAPSPHVVFPTPSPSPQCSLLSPFPTPRYLIYLQSAISDSQVSFNHHKRNSWKL